MTCHFQATSYLSTDGDVMKDKFEVSEVRAWKEISFGVRYS